MSRERRISIMSKKNITIPTVHLNGSDGNSLLNAVNNARRAIMTAKEALDKCAPHGRDYYVTGTSEAFSDAQEEYLTRYASLRQIERELGEIETGIRTQMDKEDAHRQFRQ